MSKIVTLKPKSPSPEKKNVNDIQVPDLWHTAMALKREGRLPEAKMVLDTWHLCHDLLTHIKES